MRQIFSSARLENVETLERVLIDAGIATRVTNRATWNRATKRDFNYSDRGSESRWPALWVVEADDYPRAREVLREHGVAFQTTRTSEPGYAPPPSYVPAEPAAAAPRAVNRARLALYVITLAVAVLTALKLARVL